jgi:transposase-like protein
MEGCSEKIGGPNKTAEIDESKFGKRKYNRGHPVKGQWVFGGVERESGKTFLVPVPDRTAETSMAVIDAWIEPGTTVIIDCWGAYRDLDAQGYTHYTVNHSIGFVDQRTSAHTNTIESTWRHVKAHLSPYNRQVDNIYHLAHYMFVAKCRAEKVHPFTKFLHLVATTDWSLCPPALLHRPSSDVLLVSGHVQLHLPPQVHAHGSSKPSVVRGNFRVLRDS